MRRFIVSVTALTAVFGALVIAQTTVTTLEEYTKLMKSNAMANGAMNKAIGSGAYADARTQVRILPGGKAA